MEEPDDLDDILDSALEDFGEADVEATKPESTGKAVESDAVADDALEELNEIMNQLGKETEQGGDPLPELGGDIDEAQMDQLVNMLAEQFGQLGDNEGTEAPEGGGLPGGAGFENMVEQMVGQLLDKDVLKKPMDEMRAMYREFLGRENLDLEPAELERFRKQQGLVGEICDAYDRNAESQEVMELLQQLQECGAPPDQVIQAMNEGSSDKEGEESVDPLDPASLARLEELQRQCPIQ